MDTFNEVLSVAQKGVIAFGTFWVVWGLVVLGSGLKDKTAPDIKQGIGQMCGGAVIILAGAMISNIHFLSIIPDNCPEFLS